MPVEILERQVMSWRAHARVEKFSPDQTAWAVRKSGLLEPGGSVLRRLCGKPEDGIREVEGNLLVTVGLNKIGNLIIGTGSAFTNTLGGCGVGSSATAAVVGDTVLGGNGSTTTAYYQGLDATFPTQSNGLISAQATYASANGNFAWNEWGWFGIASGTITAGGTLASVGTTPVLLNHKIASLGTKASGASWVFSTSVQLS